MKTIMEKDAKELKLDILEFAQKHNLAIHPDKDLDGFCKRTVSVKHCICRDDELYCPCESALSSCQKDGYCTCRLFITPEKYSQELVKSRERWRRKNAKESNSLRGKSLSTLHSSERAAAKRSFLSQRR